MEKKLKETETYDLFKTVEMPLVEVLMQVEKNGVSLNTKFLGKMSKELDSDLKKLVKEIYKLSGEEFNINSPQQLGQILFEKLEIHKELGNRRPPRTPTGQYSTSENVLEKFSEHHLVNKILDNRKLAKLKSTYVDALPKLISSHTGRLHTSFNQTVTATGRLSSSDPNLQNIPEPPRVNSATWMDLFYGLWFDNGFPDTIWSIYIGCIFIYLMKTDIWNFRKQFVLR